MEISNKLIALRKAAKAQGLYAKYFTSGNTGFSPLAITNDLRQLLKVVGIDLPKEAAVGLDTIQIILAGGTIVNDIKEGVTILQCVGDISEGIAGVAQLLGDLGILDQQVADFASLGGNLALAISSGGVNVVADVGAIISAINVAKDLGNDFFGSEQDAKTAAFKALKTNVHAYLDPQVNYASAQLTAFHAGSLNYFDFIGNVALNSPYEFKNFFPELAVYFPDWIPVTISGSGTSSGWFSSTTDTERKTFVQLLTNHRQIESVLINKFITIPMREFQDFETQKPIITLQALTLLSLLLSSGSKGPANINYDFNVLQAIQFLGITPAKLGDEWLFKGFYRHENVFTNWKGFLPYTPAKLSPHHRLSSGISINGVPVLNDYEKSENRKTRELAELQVHMENLDLSGDIDGLMRIPEGKAMLSRWADIRIQPKFDPLGNITNMALNAGSQPITSIPGYVPGDVANHWDFIAKNYSIDISNYWKCLSIINKMKESNLFADQRSVLKEFGDTDMLLSKFKTLSQFVTAKNMNRISRTNIAEAVGIPASKLTHRFSKKHEITFYKGV